MANLCKGELTSTPYVGVGAGNRGFGQDNQNNRTFCANPPSFLNVFTSVGLILLSFHINDAIVQQDPNDNLPAPPIDFFTGGILGTLSNIRVFKIGQVSPYSASSILLEA